jgi:hypothetical protein
VGGIKLHVYEGMYGVSVGRSQAARVQTHVWTCLCRCAVGRGAMCESNECRLDNVKTLCSHRDWQVSPCTVWITSPVQNLTSPVQNLTSSVQNLTSSVQNFHCKHHSWNVLHYTQRAQNCDQCQTSQHAACIISYNMQHAACSMQHAL